MLLKDVTQAFCIVLNLTPKSMYVAWECGWLSDIGIEHAPSRATLYTRRGRESVGVRRGG